MDDIDRKILKLLQQNARMSVKNLAEAVSLTPPAVSERIRKLEEGKVLLGYTAVIRQDIAKSSVKAIINTTITPEKQSAFIAFAKGQKAILCAYHVTGAFSMSISAVCEDVTELGKLVQEIQRFGKTQTLVIMSTPKSPEIEDYGAWLEYAGIE